MELQEGTYLMNELEILYEDNHVIVVYKKENILSQGDKTKDVDLLSQIKDYIKKKYKKPGNVYVGLVHRLDRPVSGIMVYAKTSKAAARLSEQIRLSEMEKQYLAVVNGILAEKKGEFRDYLKKQETGNTEVTRKNDGKESCLYYEVIEEKRGMSLVKILLKTGRHHQIRVQFASRGYPLYGDQRYGYADKKQIALSCYHLAFCHPTTKEKIVFERFPKQVGIWKSFSYLECPKVEMANLEGEN